MDAIYNKCNNEQLIDRLIKDGKNENLRCRLVGVCSHFIYSILIDWFSTWCRYCLSISLRIPYQSSRKKKTACIAVTCCFYSQTFTSLRSNYGGHVVSVVHLL